MKKIGPYIIFLFALQLMLVPGGWTWGEGRRTTSAGLFPDVPRNHWAEDEIRLLKERGIIGGYQDGLFHPDRQATRAEVVAMLVKAMNAVPRDPSDKLPFRDVRTGYWGYTAVLTGYQNRILTGFPDGTFRPESVMTRGESASMIARGFVLNSDEGSWTFTDLDASHWAYEAIQKLAQNRIAFGATDGRFLPDEPVTRAEFAVFLARSLNPLLRPQPSVNPAPTLKPSPTPAPTLSPTSAPGSGTGAGPVTGPVPTPTGLPAPTHTRTPGPDPTPPPNVSKGYTIDLKTWGISNDGTNPVETTRGINQALAWANKHRITQVRLPGGTYLIDKDSRINMVSDMTFILESSVIRKQTNGHEVYHTLYIGAPVKDATVRGGTFIGDKDTHDYSSQEFYGTHEWGYGISVEGGINVVIDGVKVREFTGDGLYIATADGYISNLNEADFESGAIDDQGRSILDPTKIRTKNRELTSLNHPFIQSRNIMQLSYPKGIDKQSLYDLYFYKSDGSLISIVKDVQFSWQDVSVPAGADYFRAVFDHPTTAGAFVRYDSKVRASHVVVTNSEISSNRRQGITVGGANDVLITKNVIHDIKGTAPQSGVDVEGAYFLNSNIKIVENSFYNNQSYDVILFDGRDAVVDGNRLGSKGAIGITNTELFKNAQILNNTLQGSFMLINQDAFAKNNTVIEGWAKFYGPNSTIQGMKMVDSFLEVASTTPYGVTVSDVTMINNQKEEFALVVNGSPVRLSNIMISGPTKLRSLAGSGAEGTVFENLKITNYNGNYGLDLPLGTYNGCVVEGSTGGESPAYANKPGGYVFNQCTFKGRAGLRIANANAEVTLKDSLFEMETPLAWEKSALTVEAAKKVSISNNVIRAMQLKDTHIALIKINNFGGALGPTDVPQAVIKGNSIQANIAAKGISTIDAGVGASPYEVEDNVLTGAVLELRPADVNKNNVVNGESSN